MRAPTQPHDARNKTLSATLAQGRFPSSLPSSASSPRAGGSQCSSYGLQVDAENARASQLRDVGFRTSLAGAPSCVMAPGAFYSPSALRGYPS
jgi:hypothetical protein